MDKLNVKQLRSVLVDWNKRIKTLLQATPVSKMNKKQLINEIKRYFDYHFDEKTGEHVLSNIPFSDKRRGILIRRFKQKTKKVKSRIDEELTIKVVRVVDDDKSFTGKYRSLIEKEEPRRRDRTVLKVKTWNKNPSDKDVLNWAKKFFKNAKFDIDRVDIETKTLEHQGRIGEAKSKKGRGTLKRLI